MARYIAATPIGKKREALYANARKEVQLSSSTVAIRKVYYSAWLSFHLCQRLVLAHLLVQYFCLPDWGENMRPQPGHSFSSAR